MQPTQLQTLLCNCLQAGGIHTQLEQWKTISPDDWAQLIQFAGEQSIAAPLYPHLKPLVAAHIIPAALLQPLRADYQHHTMRNMRLYHELGQVLLALNAEQIPVIVLKGAFLAETVYPEIGLRPMSDMDLLIHPADGARVATALARLGYHPQQPLLIDEHFAIHQHLPPFVKPASQTMIEVHASITPPRQAYSIAVDELWARAMPVTLAGVPTQALAPEDLILHLCAHLCYQHLCVAGLGSLYDLAPVIAHYQNQLDWDALCSRAERWGWSRGVYLTFQLAVTMLGAAVPEPVLARLQPSDFDAQILQTAQGQLLGEVTVNDIPSMDFVRVLYSRNMAEMVRIGLARFFPARRELAALYHIPTNHPRLYFYYLVRCKDLLGRYGHALWQRFDPHKLAEAPTQRQHTLFGWLHNT